MDTKNLTIYGLNENIAFCEAQGLSKCFQAYADNCAGEDIMQIGFNSNSGYVYIALEFNCISICSMLGREVEFLVTNFEDGEETFFNTYEEAEEFLNKMNEAE
jgi:hypothetical protein